MFCPVCGSEYVAGILKAENQYAVDATYTIGPLARRRILVRESDLSRAQEILRASPVPDSQHLSDPRPQVPDPQGRADC